MVDRFVGKKGELRNWLQSLHPVGRLGTSEEIAAAVLYLASHAAKLTTTRHCQSSQKGFHRVTCQDASLRALVAQLIPVSVRCHNIFVLMGAKFSFCRTGFTDVQFSFYDKENSRISIP
jgi:hypothetical protein